MKFFPQFQLAWLQLTHSKLRLVVALAGIAFAVILIFMQLGFLNSLFESQTALHKRFNADLVIINSNLITLSQAPLRFPQQYLYRVLNFEEVEAVNTFNYNRNLLKYGTDIVDPILVIGINPENPSLYIEDFDRVAHWLKTPGFALFDANSDRKLYGELLRDLQGGQAQVAELNNQRIRIAGTVDFIGASFGEQGYIIMGSSTFKNLTNSVSKDDIAVGLITLKSGVDQQKTIDKIRKQLPGNLSLMTLADFIELEKNFWRATAPLGFVFGLGVLVSCFVGTIIVYQILYSEVSEHLSDYALLKARGYRHHYLLSMLFQECLLLAVMGYIPGLIVSLGLYRLTEFATSIPMEMTTSREILVLALTIIMCFISGVISMQKLNEAAPADLFS